MKKEYKPLEKITVEPKDNFTHNGQIKSALVRIADLKEQIAVLKAEIERLNKRLRLFEGHLK
jgi:uncharacterized small protein (DUF1192 family)